jgi:lactoylglutathione lyase
MRSASFASAATRTASALFQPSRAAARPARRMAAATASSEWAQQDERRMLHAVYRVGNMDEYIAQMKANFGMQLLRYRDIPEEKYTNAFIGYGPETTNFCME